jgi:hypothetical protein
MNTFIVSTVLATGNPAHPPQVDIWAVRTSNSAQAQSMVLTKLGSLEPIAMGARSLNDAAKNVLQMADDEIRTL